MCALTQIVWGYGLGCHKYADDTQLYLLMNEWPDSSPDVLDRILQAIVGLTTESTEAKSSEDRGCISKLWSLEISIQIPTLNRLPLVPVPRVKSLLMDASLSTESQVTTTAWFAFYRVFFLTISKPHHRWWDIVVVLQYSGLLSATTVGHRLTVAPIQLNGIIMYALLKYLLFEICFKHFLPENCCPPQHFVIDHRNFRQNSWRYQSYKFTIRSHLFSFGQIIIQK